MTQPLNKPARSRRKMSQVQLQTSKEARLRVLITSASGLQAVYGSSGCGAILETLNSLLQASTGSVLRVLDDPNSMPNGMVTTSQNPDSLRSILQASNSNNPMPEAVVIVGDERILPPFTVQNPVTDRSIDPDTIVTTDNPYGDFTTEAPSECVNPAAPVGRIAAGIDATAEAFCDILRGQIAPQRPLRVGYVEISSRQWQDASSFVLSSVGPARVFISPDSVLNAADASNLDCKFLYCNLHGFPNQAAWMGYDPGLGYPVPAVTPDAFQSQYVSGTVVFTEACYGLYIAGKTTSASCALSLLASGAAAVVGCTGLAFGTASVKSQNLIDADALAQGFFNTALQAGQTVGTCLKAARSTLSQTGSDPFINKTLLAFQLLGDPTHVVS